MDANAAPDNAGGQAQPRMLLLENPAHHEENLRCYYSMYKRGMYTDAVLAVDDCQIKVHRMVLAASSSVFERYFSITDDRKTTIVMPGSKKWMVKPLVEFIYNGRVEVAENSQTFKKLLELGDLYKVRGLTRNRNAGELTGEQTVRPSVHDNWAREEMTAPANASPHQAEKRRKTTPGPSAAAPRRTERSSSIGDSASALLQAAAAIEAGAVHSMGAAAAARSNVGRSEGKGRKKAQPKKVSRTNSPPVSSPDQGIASGYGSSPASATSESAAAATPAPVDFSQRSTLEMMLAKDKASKASVLDSLLYRRSRHVTDEGVSSGASSHSPNSRPGSSTAVAASEEAAAAALQQQQQQITEAYLNLMRNRPAGPSATITSGEAAAQAALAAAVSAASGATGGQADAGAAAAAAAAADKPANFPNMAPMLDSIAGVNIPERIRSHFLSSNWLQMNQTAAAAAAAAGVSNGTQYVQPAPPPEHGGGEEGEAEDMVEEEEEEFYEGDEGVSPPPADAGGMPPPPPRPRGRPASASISRDEHGNPRLGPNGKPMVKCEQCGKELADPSSLYRHRKIHSGEKPHMCPFCHRRFIQRYNMRQHLKTHKHRGDKITKEMVDKLEPDLREVFQNNHPF